MAPDPEKTMCQTFSFPEVDFHSVPPEPGPQARVPKAFSDPTNAGLSDKRLMEISGHGPPKWQTFSSESRFAREMDLAVFRHCHGSNRWHGVDTAWFASLLGKKYVVRRKGTQERFLSLGHVQATGAIGWPMASEGGLLHIRQDVVPDDLQLMVCLDPTEWEVLPVDWWSPLRNAQFHGPEHTCVGIACRPKGDWQELLVTCAWDAFFDLPVPALKIICALPSVRCATTETGLFGVLRDLINTLLPQATEEEKIAILQKRLVGESRSLPDIFKDPEMLEVFDEDDQKMVQEMIKEDERETETRKKFMEKLHAHVKSQSSGAAASSSNGGRRAPKRPRTSRPANPYVPPAWSWSVTPTAEQAQLMVPRGCTISQDTIANRWKAAHPIMGTISRAWLRYGVMESLHECLMQLWRWEIMCTGTTCPVEGLFENNES